MKKTSAIILVLAFVLTGCTKKEPETLNASTSVLKGTQHDVGNLAKACDISTYESVMIGDQEVEQEPLTFKEDSTVTFSSKKSKTECNIKVMSVTEFFPDTFEEDLILVDKQIYIGSDYVPSLVDIPEKYAVSSGYRATARTTEAIIEMVNAMYEETGMWMYVTSAYRSYERQEQLYNNYVAEDGQEAADTYSARPGHSEHQTGLTIDFVTPGGVMDDFGLTEQSEWVNQNAPKYGFIVRYTEENQNETGYMPEAWHLRYLGKQVATYVYDNELSYDAFYTQHVK